MKINEIAASWDRAKVSLGAGLHPIESWNRAIRSPNRRVLERSAAEAVACKYLEYMHGSSLKIDHKTP